LAKTGVFLKTSLVGFSGVFFGGFVEKYGTFD
jgi:hypothetical protein